MDTHSEMPDIPSSGPELRRRVRQAALDIHARHDAGLGVGATDTALSPEELIVLLADILEQLDDLQAARDYLRNRSAM